MPSHLRFTIIVLVASAFAAVAADRAVDATTLRGKMMCGYQGWFRCPGDAAGSGWAHWSRDGRRLTPDTLTFEMWPDMSEFAAEERYAVPGFSHPDGAPAFLFSSDHPATVRRHFQWMRDAQIDVAWLQHFVVELPGAPGEKRYQSRRRVVEHVRAAAHETGRAWALTYDVSGMPQEGIFDALTSDWKRMVEEGLTKDPRYLHHDGRPAVMLFGFYTSHISAEIGNRLVDFFAASGPHAAFLLGSGAWDWRRNANPEWVALYRRLGAYLPWNVANYETTRDGKMRATTNFWAADQQDCEGRGALWIPVVYPGFGWDNLKRLPPGASTIPRRGGKFLWEQFRAASQLRAEAVYIAMFDEVDEATAVFKVTNSPPVQARFLDYEGFPPDWYLRLIREAATRMRSGAALPEEIPIRP